MRRMRLERLRWLPMLLRAYYEAERTVKAQPNEQTVMANPDKNNRRQSLRQPATARKNKVSEASTVRKPPSKPPVRPSRKPTVAPNTTAQLYRELKEANRRLEELAAMQRQLESIGAAMEDVNRKIEALRTEADNPERVNAKPLNSPEQSPPRPPQTWF
ncbi:hypothetical protein C7445_11432 [Alicyclobacillus sacchari]|uniref:Uncharacterized protein n=1 Tax=Alicyclobacillus sacchari TaxID=392010 RepID=A0A4R8LHE2_9BACL|nr:hypothetical protein [Alicyclobacillus sacchari]TDY42599.1 hypothetical protein C7445_11432 [Alicyclobacillus sacchari]GMA58148.1 hypothetical protein GCM10025858_26510 [Alicyclobacillus sacchari]